MDIKQNVRTLAANIERGITIGLSAVMTAAISNIYRIIVLIILGFLYVQSMEVHDNLRRMENELSDTRIELSSKDSLLASRVDSLFKMHPWRSPKK